MSKSAFLHYDPSAYAEEYGWLWVEDGFHEPDWELIHTIADEGELRVYFVKADHTEDADLYAGRPFVRVSPPPEDGDQEPGFILTIDTSRGERMMFVWGPDGAGRGEFAQIVSGAVEHAMAGGEVQ